MTQQILYFTAGSVPTEAENTEIAEIEAVTNPYAVRIANGSMPVVNGISPSGPILQDVSFVAGTPPAEYAGVPVFDINDVIPPELLDTDAIVSDGIKFNAVVNAVTMEVTPVVADSKVTTLNLPNDVATVSNAKTKPIHNSSGETIGNGTTNVTGGRLNHLTMPATFAGVTNAANVTCNLNGVSRVLTPTVAAGVLTEMQTPATVAAVATAASAPVQNSAGAAIGAGTITIANRAITNIRLPATIAGVANGAKITLDGFEYTFTVAGGVITAIDAVEVEIGGL